MAGLTSMDMDAGYDVPKKLLEFERAIYSNDEKKGEAAAVFSAEGRLVCRFAGFLALKIDESECPNARGSILTHNHVSDTAFSMHDIKTASELNLIEIRVVGSSGWHSMRPGPKGWPSPLMISKTYSRISTEAAALQGDEDMREFSIHICKRLADELGLVYKKGDFGENQKR